MPKRKRPASDKKRLERLEKPKDGKKRKRARKEEGNGGEKEEKEAPRTIENTREKDETIIQPDDTEALEDIEMDDFADYFAGVEKPRLLITTTAKPSKRAEKFVRELELLFPMSEYRKRGTYSIQDICKWSSKREFNNVIIVGEAKRGELRAKEFHTLTLIHLPNGPTASFKLTNVVLPKEIRKHGKTTSHYPEVILNRFNTRLGATIGRFFASLVPRDPEFKGRRVITFHNQRDFIFFRHHRYIFDSAQKARLQELGPRFTLKLRWLQRGTYDVDNGEYEWIYKRELATSRRRFFL